VGESSVFDRGGGGTGLHIIEKGKRVLPMEKKERNDLREEGGLLQRGERGVVWKEENFEEEGRNTQMKTRGGKVGDSAPSSLYAKGKSFNLKGKNLQSEGRERGRSIERRADLRVGGLIRVGWRAGSKLRKTGEIEKRRSQVRESSTRTPSKRTSISGKGGCAGGGKGCICHNLEKRGQDTSKRGR